MTTPVDLTPGVLFALCFFMGGAVGSLYLIFVEDNKYGIPLLILCCLVVGYILGGMGGIP
jgi:hypothetical protein